MWGGGYNDGTTASSFGASSHKILSQANQNFTCHWYPSNVDVRRKNAGDGNKNVLGSIETKEFDELGVRADEIVVGWNDGREGASNDFTGFNLIDVTGMDDEDMEEAISIRGRSISTAQTAGDGVTYDGIEVTSRGSGSIYPTSAIHWKPGDLIMAEFPSTNKEKYEAQMRERPAGLRAIGGPEDSKAVVINRRFEPSAIDKIARYAATRAITEAESSTHDLHTWREVKSGLKSGKFTNRESHVIARKMAQNVPGYNTVMHLIRTGWLVPSWDHRTVRPGTNPEHFSRLLDALSAVPRTNSTQFQIDSFHLSGGASSFPEAIELDGSNADVVREELRDISMVISSILGLAKDPRRYPHLHEQKNITSVLAIRNNGGESSDYRHRIAASSLIAEDFGADKIQTPKNGIYDPSSGIASQTLVSVLNGAGEYTRYNASLFTQMLRKVFFQVTGEAQIGDMIDGFS